MKYWFAEELDPPPLPLAEEKIPAVAASGRHKMSVMSVFMIIERA